jgi:hypothetical protein
MKKIFLTTILFLVFVFICLIGILSTTGIETDKFNNIIYKKINDNNKNILLNLKKIKYKFDINNLSLFLETKEPELEFKDLRIPIKNIRIYFDLTALIKKENKINKINVVSGELNIKKLQKIIVKTKPSNLNSFIINKVKKGKLNTELEFYLDNNQKIENFIAKGEVTEMQANLINSLSLKKTSFNFFADSSDILIKNVKSNLNGIALKDGHLQIQKKEKIIVKSDFNSKIVINKKNVKNFLPLFKEIQLKNEKINLVANVNHFLDISFDNTLKVIDYNYINKGQVKELSLKLDKPLKNPLLEKNINNLSFKDVDINLIYGLKKKNSFTSKGKYSFDNVNFQNFDLKNNFSNQVSLIKLNFDFIETLYVDIINYKKGSKKVAKIFTDLTIKKNQIFFNKLEYEENKSSITIEKLKIDKKKFISLKKIKVKTYEKENLTNDFTLEYSKKIKISGNKYNAKNLNKILNQSSTDSNFEKISKNIEIDLKNIITPLSRKLQNFKLLGAMEKGKFVKITSKGDFGNNKFLDISMKNDEKNKKQYLEIYSDLPQPLLSEYSFFQGLTGGVLIFNSIIEKDSSSSKLIIENFKVINAPGVVKLLSLADFAGLADIAEGEGLSFDKIEINMTNNNGFIKLSELYAVGPSISVLMEGYKEKSGLTSLRGTLVPAKNLNKFLSKIPVIGNIIIPQEVGEGLFGVSFKMKGMPGKIKTSINPIKTLTPRFITRALERSRKTK